MNASTEVYGWLYPRSSEYYDSDDLDTVKGDYRDLLSERKYQKKDFDWSKLFSRWHQQISIFKFHEGI